MRGEGGRRRKERARVRGWVAGWSRPDLVVVSVETEMVNGEAHCGLLATREEILPDRVDFEVLGNWGPRETGVREEHVGRRG